MGSSAPQLSNHGSKQLQRTSWKLCQVKQKPDQIILQLAVATSDQLYKTSLFLKNGKMIESLVKR